MKFINKNMNNKLLISLVLLATMLSSCKKWLEVQPESEIAAPVLFSTESGFMEGLNGIYSKCTFEQLYGKELTFGIPEALAQNYTTTVDDQKYRQTALYNYRDGDFIGRKDQIWATLYSSIVNCNLVLVNIDEHKNVFTGSNFGLIKGEALALRAYLHFDALRLFAPSYLRNPSGAGVPYVTTYSKEITPLSSVSETIDKAIKDLEEAKKLMVSDPIRSASYIVGYPSVKDTLLNGEEKSPVLFLQNRRHRLNYYAVCGILARIYLYKNDKVNALLNAEEVIGSKKFPWTANNDFNASEDAKKDRILYKELVFGWYIPGSAKKIKEDWFRGGVSGLYIQKDAARFVYETGTSSGGNDLRFKNWFTFASDGNGGEWYDIVKYKRNPLSTEANANLHYLMAPAIRLSEMYYIAAECTYGVNPEKAVDYLNTVRFARGLDNLSVSSQSTFMTELIKECRKEWFAEGQMFFMYKRLNIGIYGQTGTIIPPSDNIFVLPLPSDELVYGGR